MIAPTFPIRLIALDIDGTLVDDELTIGPRTRAAIRAAMERDVAVSLVTGRMVSSAIRFARELGLTGPVVGYQGGLIRAMPEEGSPRLGRLCEIPGLRSWRIKGFPMLWLYFEAEDHLDVVRLLGDRQDIAAILTAQD